MTLPIPIHITISEQPTQFNIKIKDASERVGVATSIPIITKVYPTYTDSYVVTPTNSEQVLDTTNKLLTQDIVVGPIPSNYGLITWNGSMLHIS